MRGVSGCHRLAPACRRAALEVAEKATATTGVAAAQAKFELWEACCMSGLLCACLQASAVQEAVIDGR